MKISICMITYNHEDYIVKAIESVLEQITKFQFELVIGEDNSTDGTRQICENYAAKFPETIKLLPAEKNLGMMNNFLRTWAYCDGKFVAFLEGDDYWTDPFKLNKQADFLQKNADYCACFHNALKKTIKDGVTVEWPFHESLPKDTFVTEDLLSQWFIPTASAMIVKYPDFVIPAWFKFCKSGDIPFMLLLSQYGKIKYFNEIMSVYRIHETGISKTHIGYDKIIAMIYIYENFNIHTAFKYHKKIREAVIYEINHHLPHAPSKKDSNHLPLISWINKAIKRNKRALPGASENPCGI